MKAFNGRVIVKEDISGQAVVSKKPFNNLASFYNTVLTNQSTAICNDIGNNDTYMQVLTDRVLCVPKTIGSTSAGAIWEEIANKGIAPKALLVAESIDSLAAAGTILANVWHENTVVVIDRLGQEFLDYVATGDTVEIKNNQIVVHKTKK